jgi:hypothetical protein
MIRPSIDPLVVAILLPPHASSFMHFHFLHSDIYVRCIYVRCQLGAPSKRTGGRNAVSHQIEQIVERGIRSRSLPRTASYYDASVAIKKSARDRSLFCGIAGGLSCRFTAINNGSHWSVERMKHLDPKTSRSQAYQAFKRSSLPTVMTSSSRARDQLPDPRTASLPMSANCWSSNRLLVHSASPYRLCAPLALRSYATGLFGAVNVWGHFLNAN